MVEMMAVEMYIKKNVYKKIACPFVFIKACMDPKYSLKIY